MMKKHSILRYAWPVALAFGLVFCGDGDGEEGATPDPDEGQTFKQTITASAGGTLQTESGNMTLEVPAGALAADTELTVTVAAKESGTVTSVYELGPAGTTFSTPATLSVKYDGDPGNEKKAVLATLSEGAWTEIPGSTASGGMVSGEISHFSKFSIIVVDDKTVMVSGCADVAENFSPCGGDVQGTWKFQDICMQDFMIPGNPWAETCPEATFEFETTWDATVTIDATTMSINWASQTTSYSFIAPLTCLPPDALCSDITNAEMTEMTCAEDGTTCKCSGQQSSAEMPDTTVSYTLEGNNIVVDDGGATTSQPYCRQGDKLIVKATIPQGDKPPLEVFEVLVKQ